LSGKLITDVGMCGKIPGRGDFLAQGLAPDFVDSWNEWLQAVLAVSREQLADTWLSTYLTSPVWHFALSAGVCGKDAIMGCLMPSVDQVGRHYPLTLAKVMPCTPVHARNNSTWSDVLEQQALLTLEDDFNFDSWLAAMAQAQFDWPQPQQISTAQMAPAQGRPAWVLQSNCPLDAALLLHHSYRQQFGRYCLWWTAGSEQVSPCTLVTNGLPQVSQYAAMLAGDWQRWHWQSADINCSGTV
jgi:type VI secretion system protein ImpM